MKTCKTCGCEKHSLFRFVKGWICYQIFWWTVPVTAPRWYFDPMCKAFVPSAGDYMHDYRNCSCSTHQRKSK